MTDETDLRFSVVLDAVGADPIRVVQALVSAVGMDPMAAMGLIGRAPAVVAAALQDSRSERVAQQLREAGASVTVLPEQAGERGATLREAVPERAAPSATVREAAADSLPPGADAAASASSYQRALLLPALTGRYRRISDLPAGGEADVILVSDDSGNRWVVKQFRQQGWSSDEQVLERLAAARGDHTLHTWSTDERTRSLLWVEQWGLDPASGLFYEVAEYVPGGRLTRLDAWPLTALIRALTDATCDFHEAVGAHRDIKPANLLVRDAALPVLVLADVGLARALDGSKRFSKRDGSAAYQAPEAAQGMISRAGDWWAIGMIVAQAALGYHPLALPDGSMPADQMLWTELAQRDVPHLDQIRDERVQMLARGLLNRDSQQRWGADQVRAWERGESPEVGQPRTPGTQGGAVRVAPARVRPVWFHGQDFSEPAALAAECANNTQLAGQMLFQHRDGLLREDIRLMLQSHGLHEAQAMIDRYQSGDWRPTFLRLLLEMDPNLAPRLDRQDVTPAAMYGLCRQAIAAGSCPAELHAAMDWIIDGDLWRSWRGLPGMKGSAKAAETLKTYLRHWEQVEVGPGAGAGEWKTLLMSPKGECEWWNGPQADHTEILDAATTTAFWSTPSGIPMVRAWLVLGSAWEALAPDPGGDWDQLSAEYTDFRSQNPNQHDLAGAILDAERDLLPQQAWWQRLVQHGATAPIAAAVVSLPLAKLAQAECDRTIAEARAEAARRREATDALIAALAQERQQIRALPKLKFRDPSLIDQSEDLAWLQSARVLLTQLSAELRKSFLSKDWNRIGELEDQLGQLGIRMERQ